MKYKFIIPSYNRAEILKQKTLNLLVNVHKIPVKNIEILLSTPEEGEEYRKILGDLYPKDFTYHYQKGIGAVRNFIRYHYKYETDLKYAVYIDDDIDMICKMDKKIKNLDQLIKMMFKETESRNLCLWGVSGFSNPFFMKENISTNLRYICGAFCGEIIDRKKHDIYTDFDHYEDFQFTCEHFLRDGGVVRNNGVCVVTKYFGDGGINASYGGIENRRKDMKKAGYEFIDRYGDMARLIIKNYGYDLRLNWKFKI